MTLPHDVGGVAFTVHCKACSGATDPLDRNAIGSLYGAASSSGNDDRDLLVALHRQPGAITGPRF